MTKPQLRGIGWDHPRCSRPLDEAARQWLAEGRGLVQWTYRSLAEFNSGPLDDLAREFDLLVVDHPALPHDAALFHPLDALPAVQDAHISSIGGCAIAYDWDGSTLAVPIDVAAHVSARLPDLLDDLSEPYPRDWPAVLRLAERHPGQVIASLTGDDALCTLLTITASMGEPITAETAPTVEAVDLLVRLAERCPPACRHLRPPAILELLSDGKAAYTPALFGYATYLRRPGARLVYGPVPEHPRGSARGVMGGAGLAISASTRHPEAAFRFLEWVSSPSVQRSALLAAGGQPAAKALWDDPAADALLGGFLSQTRQATECASVRLRHPKWSTFQVRAARVLGAALAQGWESAAVHSALVELHADVFPTEQ